MYAGYDRYIPKTYTVGQKLRHGTVFFTSL